MSALRQNRTFNNVASRRIADMGRCHRSLATLSSQKHTRISIAGHFFAIDVRTIVQT